MLAKKAVYENGKITFADQTLPEGKMTVIVTFLDDDDDQRPRRVRTAGLHRGSATLAEDFDAPLDDAFWLGSE